MTVAGALSRLAVSMLALAAFIGGIVALTPSIAFAHEVRPAYLELTEQAPGSFDVLFKTPMIGDRRLALSVEFSDEVGTPTPIVSRTTDGAMVQTWRVHAKNRLADVGVQIVGLQNTVSDALLRVQFVDGRSFVRRLTPAVPQATIPAEQSSSGVAATYLWLGVEHILLGYDHLLFVLGLVLLAAHMRQLVLAITAFTAAHSITLAAAVLGVVHVPPKPVEAMIALSIAFVAQEIIRARQGKISIATSFPWVVAFAFGLLHGFGFAGALSEIGIPEGHIPLALLFFNLGVEAGQVLFVGAVLASWTLVRHLRLPLPRWAASAPAYAIGSLAMFWMIQRVSMF